MRTIQRDIVGGFIISADGKLLLGKAGVYTEMWCVPGGGIEEGETKEQALHREILEETGIDISRAEVEPIHLDLTGESEKTLRTTGERVFVEMTFHNFVVRLPQAADGVEIKAEDDFTDARWIPLGDLIHIPLAQPTITTLAHLGYLPPQNV
jgi:8-oxo-dGTP pyrophosphatase MutT (NUDIX family)